MERITWHVTDATMHVRTLTISFYLELNAQTCDCAHHINFIPISTKIQMSFTPLRVKMSLCSQPKRIIFRHSVFLKTRTLIWVVVYICLAVVCEVHDLSLHTHHLQRESSNPQIHREWTIEYMCVCVCVRNHSFEPYANNMPRRSFRLTFIEY